MLSLLLPLKEKPASTGLGAGDLAALALFMSRQQVEN